MDITQRVDALELRIAALEAYTFRNVDYYTAHGLLQPSVRLQQFKEQGGEKWQAANFLKENYTGDGALTDAQIAVIVAEVFPG